MKHIKISLLIISLATGGIFYFNHTKKADAQTKNNCTPAQVVSTVQPVVGNIISSTVENYPIYKFRIQNNSTCIFTMKDFKFQELLNENGSVISELQVQSGGVNVGNELVASKIGDEITYERSISDINNIPITIPANSSKDFTVLATEFGSVSMRGDAFALGLQYYGGFLNSNIQVNNWNFPIKWGSILSIQQ